MNLSLMPDYIYQQFAANGKMLSGGTIYFYQSGTLTPQTVFADAAGTTPLGTSVTLSASGTAVIFLGPGAYRIWIKDANGVQVAPWVDGILGSAGSGLIGSNATFGVYKLYADVRALTVGPDFVYVSGGTAEGDGGAGWFQLQPGSALTDDAGVILTASSGALVYKRVFDAVLDPRWYGVAYAVNVDQTANLNKAIAASAGLGFPVAPSRWIYINQSITVPSGASLKAGAEAFFTSTAPVNFTFAAGSYFDGQGVTFGAGVQPVFNAGVCSQILLSWMGATSDDARWAKLGASATVEYKALADVPTSISSDPAVPANFALDFTVGAKITFTALANLTIGNLVYQGVKPIFKYNAAAYVGSVSLGNASPLLEWFGFLPGTSHALDNQTAFKAAVSAGAFWLRAGTHYYVQSNGGALTLSVSCMMNGSAGAVLESDQVLATTNLTLNGIAVTGTGALTPTNPATVTGSIVATISKVGTATDSTFSAFAGALYGNLLRCTFATATPASASVMADIQFENCLMGQAGGNEVPLFSVDAAVTRIDIISGQIELYPNSLLVYSESTSLNIYMTSVRNSSNWSQSLTNGYAKIHLFGCQGQKNSTAYEIDGNILKADILPDPTVADSVASGNAYWKGIGTPTSDGTWLTLGSAATLANTPWSANTIRYLGGNGTTTESDPALLLMYRYGGLVTIEVAWPAGSTADPNIRLQAAFCTPGFNTFYSGVGFFGKAIWSQSMTVSPIANVLAKTKITMPVWGGQIDQKTSNIDGSTYVMTDQWGDISYSVVGAGRVLFIPRIVIFNAGSGTLPIGTRIKCTITPKLPTTEVFNAFWPDLGFNLIMDSVWYPQATSAYYGFAVLQWPYIFRDCSRNRLEVDLARIETATPFPHVLAARPLYISAWVGGNTINSSIQ
jgi:hypothetical protein